MVMIHSLPSERPPRRPLSVGFESGLSKEGLLYPDESHALGVMALKRAWSAVMELQAASTCCFLFLELMFCKRLSSAEVLQLLTYLALMKQDSRGDDDQMMSINLMAIQAANWRSSIIIISSTLSAEVMLYGYNKEKGEMKYTSMRRHKNLISVWICLLRLSPQCIYSRFHLPTWMSLLLIFYSGLAGLHNYTMAQVRKCSLSILERKK